MASKKSQQGGSSMSRSRRVVWEERCKWEETKVSLRSAGVSPQQQATLRTILKAGRDIQTDRYTKPITETQESTAIQHLQMSRVQGWDVKGCFLTTTDTMKTGTCADEWRRGNQSLEKKPSNMEAASRQMGKKINKHGRKSQQRCYNQNKKNK